MHIWRRSYDIRPPSLNESDPRYPANDPRYRDLEKEDLPLTESLKDTTERFMPIWHSAIAPSIQSGKKIFIAAHGNSLRALVKHLDGISDEKIASVNIPTGVPLIYELDTQLNRTESYYLGDQEIIKNSIETVVDQGQVVSIKNKVNP